MLLKQQFLVQRTVCVGVAVAWRGVLDPSGLWVCYQTWLWRGLGQMLACPSLHLLQEAMAAADRPVLLCYVTMEKGS